MPNPRLRLLSSCLHQAPLQASLLLHLLLQWKNGHGVHGAPFQTRLAETTQKMMVLVVVHSQRSSFLQDDLLAESYLRQYVFVHKLMFSAALQRFEGARILKVASGNQSDSEGKDRLKKAPQNGVCLTF